MGKLEKSKKAYKRPSKLHRFYKSDDWHLVRAKVIVRENGLCEKCKRPGNEVHHIIHLTVNNVDDPSVSLNPDNLMLLCTDCHNKEHHRFGKHPSRCTFSKDGDLIDVKEEKSR